MLCLIDGPYGITNMTVTGPLPSQSSSLCARMMKNTAFSRKSEAKRNGDLTVQVVEFHFSFSLSLLLIITINKRPLTWFIAFHKLRYPDEFRYHSSTDSLRETQKRVMKFSPFLALPRLKGIKWILRS